MEAKDLRQRARQNLAGRWWYAVGVAAVAWILGGTLVGSGFIPKMEFKFENLNLNDLPALLQMYIFGGAGLLAVVGSALGLAQFILGGVIELGYAQYLLKEHDHRDPQFNDLFSQFDRFGQGFAQAFLRGLYTFLWSLLFIIPGIVKGLSYAMTPFIMAENPGLTASEAISASKQMMDGHKGRLFWLSLTFIGWGILCALTFNLGYLFLNPYMNAAYAAFYRDLCARRSSQQYQQY